MLSVAVFLCLLVILVSGFKDFFISVLPAVQTVPVRSLWMGSSSGRTNYREGVQPVLQHSMSDRRAVLNMTNFFFFCLLLLCFNHTELKVNPGQDAPLQCQGPRDAEITLLEWNRADLKSDDYVFMYRNQRPYESYQHESFRGRVDLMDPTMKDGNVSVTLRNVRLNDTGTYKCQITTKETERVVHECAISLTVTTSDKHTKESQTESKDGGERVKCLSVIILVLSVFVVLITDIM